jgi:rhodanese-related sulfurtransferase
VGAVIAFPAGVTRDEGIPPQQLRRELARNPGLAVIDLRGMREFFCGATGRLPGAINVPFALLETCLPELGSLRARRLVLVCATGAQAPEAAAGLRRAGFRDVAALRGGMNLWARLGYPRELPPLSRIVA